MGNNSHGTLGSGRRLNNEYPVRRGGRSFNFLLRSHCQILPRCIYTACTDCQIRLGRSWGHGKTRATDVYTLVIAHRPLPNCLAPQPREKFSQIEKAIGFRAPFKYRFEYREKLTVLQTGRQRPRCSTRDTPRSTPRRNCTLLRNRTVDVRRNRHSCVMDITLCLISTLDYGPTVISRVILDLYGWI